MKNVDSKFLLGLLIGAAVGTAIGVLAATDKEKKEQWLDDLNDLASKGVTKGKELCNAAISKVKGCKEKDAEIAEQPAE
ncbi:MAG: YtxH domain-containing protein [Parabacteroides sp.]